jgi:glycosyltransferase A (GT-A) superfamily protein (DUF2064 family)
MSRTAIGVMAEAPIAGRCKTSLLAAHAADWVTGLYAAMLRDTLDGLQAVPADAYVVFVEPRGPAPADEPSPQLALDVLARHLPSPWELVALEGDDLGARIQGALAHLLGAGASYAIVSGSDAPSFPTEPLESAVADTSTRASILLGPSAAGGYHLIGMPRVEPRVLEGIPWSTPAVLATTRLRCRELGLTVRELPAWYEVQEPSDVLALLDELRAHPERAPRTAQFLTKNA